MRSFAALLFISLLMTCASHATPPITISLKRSRYSGSPKDIRNADRARLAFIMNGTVTDTSTTIPLTDKYAEYTTMVGIGNPPTYYSLIIDTGSANTFCGAGIRYNQTSTSIPIWQAVSVSYGTGFFTGLEYLDQVTLAPNFTIANQSIADALYASGFEGYDGILALGPVGLTNGSLPSKKNTTVPTIMNNLVTQGLIEKEILGVYYTPPRSNTSSLKDGALTFGGADPKLYRGNLMYTPVTKTYPSCDYWGVNATSATYGNYTLISNSTAGVVDTGTTLVYLAGNLFVPYMEAIPGAEIDPETGILVLPDASVPSIKPLNFVIGGHTLTLDATAQLFPEEETQGWGRVGFRYGVVNGMQHDSGRGLDFMLGKGFIQRYYVVFDTDGNRVGFASTNYTFTKNSS